MRKSYSWEEFNFLVTAVASVAVTSALSALAAGAAAVALSYVFGWGLPPRVPAVAALAAGAVVLYCTSRTMGTFWPARLEVGSGVSFDLAVTEIGEWARARGYGVVEESARHVRFQLPLGVRIDRLCMAAGRYCRDAFKPSVLEIRAPAAGGRGAVVISTRRVCNELAGHLRKGILDDGR